MEWVIRKLKISDHIRVKRDFYYHHGVYVGNNKVIHYTGDYGDSTDDPEKVSVQETSIDFFGKNGIVEVAKPSFIENLFFKNKKRKICKIAKSCIGKKGYNFLHNNCEDFANKCCYRKKLTSQIDDLRGEL